MHAVIHRQREPSIGVIAPDSGYKSATTSGHRRRRVGQRARSAPQVVPLAGSGKTVYLRLKHGTDFWNPVAEAFLASAVDCLSAVDATCISPPATYAVTGLPANNYGVTTRSSRTARPSPRTSSTPRSSSPKDAAGNNPPIYNQTFPLGRDRARVRQHAAPPP